MGKPVLWHSTASLNWRMFSTQKWPELSEDMILFKPSHPSVFFFVWWCRTPYFMVMQRETLQFFIEGGWNFKQMCFFFSDRRSGNWSNLTHTWNWVFQPLVATVTIPWGLQITTQKDQLYQDSQSLRVSTTPWWKPCNLPRSSSHHSSGKNDDHDWELEASHIWAVSTLLRLSIFFSRPFNSTILCMGPLPSRRFWQEPRSLL